MAALELGCFDYAHGVLDKMEEPNVGGKKELPQTPTSRPICPAASPLLALAHGVCDGSHVAAGEADDALSMRVPWMLQALRLHRR